MGKVRQGHIKKLAKKIYDEFESDVTDNYFLNLEILVEHCDIYSKKLRNRIAGYMTTLYKKRNNTYENIRTKPPSLKRRKKKKRNNK